MNQSAIERRLTTIVSIDVAGYSALMATNEAETLRLVKSHRSEFVDPLLQERNGRVVKLMGDGALLEFFSVVDAVEFAIRLQEVLASKSDAVVDGSPIQYRIGINIGDVIIDDDDIYGDGVNVAARIEALASPGGICISADVYNQVRRKIDAVFRDLGNKTVKNIPEPVRVYQVLPGGEAVSNRPTAWAARLLSHVSGRLYIVAAMVALLIIGYGLFEWLSRVSESDVGAPRQVSIPEDPSIAVMPFVNISDDPSQEYFADGLTEDLITDLSKISGLMVIARNSTFAYKGVAIDLRQVARELGVRYVLEGSVRRSAGSVRINAQLVDGLDGGHVWAERYDRKIKDVFAVQDEVTRNIVSALSVNLTDTERTRLDELDTTSIEAYDIRLRALETQARFTPADNAAGRALYRQAARVDPTYARAWAGIGLTHAIDVNMNWTKDRERSIRLGLEAIERALELDNNVVRAYFAKAAMLQAERRFDEAELVGRHVLELEPNYADGHAQLAFVLANAGKYEESLEAISKAYRLNPKYSQIYMYVESLALFVAGRFEEAASLLERARDRNPAFDRVHMLLASVYGHLGRIEDAEWTIAEALVLRPELNLRDERKNSAFKHEAHIDRYVEGLRKAGLPE